MTLDFQDVYDLKEGYNSDMAKQKDWVGFLSDIELASVSYPLAQATDIDLSSYLPDDNNQYEVMLYVLVNSSKTADAYVNALAKTDVVTQYTSLGATRSESSSYNSSHGSTVIIPVGTARKITLIARTNDSGAATIRLRAYR